MFELTVPRPVMFFVSKGTGDNEGDEAQERGGDVRRL